jgi:hypothetical protein
VWRTLLIVFACVGLSYTRAGAKEAGVVGTWVYVEGWQATRPDVRPGGFTSPALVLRFCSNGRFMMLKCMLYRQGHESINIGPDDGLQIYRGTWSVARGGAVVSYHLSDAEIIFPGYEAAKKQEIKASARFAGNKLKMPVIRLFPPVIQDIAASFQRKAQLPAPLTEKFIDCSELPPKT